MPQGFLCVSPYNAPPPRLLTMTNPWIGNFGALCGACPLDLKFMMCFD